MWNSPNKESETGKRYSLEAIAVLVYPLGLLLDLLESASVDKVVDESMLHSMTREEFIFSLFEVFQGLLEETPIPKGGHPGYQEALVTELLNQAYNHIVLELYDDTMDSARIAAWSSFRQLCLERQIGGGEFLALLGVNPMDAEMPWAHLADELTQEAWRDLVLGESGLWSEFLWDEDWRLQAFLDVPESISKPITESIDMNLEVIHQLPHTPNRAEYQMALHYLKYIVWKDETLTRG